MQSVFELNQYPCHEKGNDDDGYAVCVPANTADKRRVEPHSELIERQSHTQSVQQGNPRPGAVAPEHESEIAGDHEDEDSVNVMMNVHSGNRLPMNPWKEHAEDTGAHNTEDEGCCDAGWRSF